MAALAIFVISSPQAYGAIEDMFGQDSSPSQTTDDTMSGLSGEPEGESSDDGQAADAESTEASDEPLFGERVAESQPQGDESDDSLLDIAPAFAAGGVLSGTLLGAILFEGMRVAMLIAVFGPLLARRAKGDEGVLTKGRILGYIEAHPGIHFSALRDGLELANGSTSHHVHSLEREGRIISWSDGRRTRYAVPGVDPTTMHVLAHPATGIQINILNALENIPETGMSAADLRKRLECTRQLLAYHLDTLKGRELILKEGKGKASKYRLSESGRSHLEILANAQIN